MPGKSQYATDAVLNVLRNTAFAAIAAPHVGLFSTNPTDDNNAGTELSGNGYARQAVTFAAPETGGGNKRKIKNSGALTFGPATGTDWAEAIGFGVYDASSAGNLIYWDELLGPEIVYTVDPATDTFTSTAHGLTDGTRVRVRNRDGAVPTGLATGTLYYVISAAANTFQLSTSQGGSAVDVTAAGNGTNIVRKDYRFTLAVGTQQAQFAANALEIYED